MKSATVFISRSEARSGEFIEHLSQITKDVICQSFILFEPIRTTQIPETTWLFFYSQKGVEYFHLAATNLGKDIKGKIAAFGTKTAQRLIQLGYEVDFVGTGEALSTANQFGHVASGTSVLIIKGKSSLDSIKEHLDHKIKTLDLVIYSNTPKSITLSVSPDILCFTSPMNLSAFFASNLISKDQKILTIGTSTAMAGLKLGISSLYISKTPSIQALADLVKSIITDPNKVSDINLR